MAKIQKRLPSNVEGNFYVDSTCINCDTCRQLAPLSFVEKGDYSTVFHQPIEVQEELHAHQALLACPVGSIGVSVKNKDLAQQAKETFPLLFGEGVFYNGFNSEKSFGANSYFIQHLNGNWLIDSPRYLSHLVEAFEALGGIRYIFLSHEDDVADAGRYAKRFGAKRIIHQHDVHAVPEAEWIVKGGEPVAASEGFTLIPVPGHTPGSMALLYRDEFLFSGDHLWWEPESHQLGTPEHLVWNEVQLIQSCKRLLGFTFEWVLPGHGHRVHLPQEKMKKALSQLVERREKA